jgi:hypothetical protein
LGIRLTLAFGLAALGYQSVAFSFAQTVAKANPEAASYIIGYDGRIAAAHAAALIGTNTSAAGYSRAGALARQALRQEPTSVLAASTLGLSIAARGEIAGSRKLLAYAQKLSRRNVQTQLWSIEDAVGRGDIREALRWYDITLRTKPRMSDLLYPVLGSALSDPAIRAELVRTLAARPLWGDSFISYAAGQETDPQGIATLLLALRDRNVPIPETADAAVIYALFKKDRINAAWNYYSAIRSGVDRRRARDPRFSAGLKTPSLFDWVPANDSNVAASIQVGREGGTFEFSVPASVGGPLLQQVQLLPPGNYRLSGHTASIDQPSQALPYLALTCGSDGRELGRVMVPNSSQATGNFAGNLTVPAECPVQVLTLTAQPSDAMSGVSGQFDRIALEPAMPRVR